MIKKAKGAYNRQLLEDNKDNDKAFWRTVKKIIPGESKEVSSNIKVGENIISDKLTIATAFNKYFVGTVTRLFEPVGRALYDRPGRYDCCKNI